MSDTELHLAASAAPATTGEYAKCKLCGCQWQVRADSDKKGCAFCGSDETAVIVINEDVD